MQLLTKGSEEGNSAGLGWLDTYTEKFNFSNGDAHLKIPHMGWNEVSVSKPHPLIKGLEQQSRFYFVHSYYVQCKDPADELLRCHYGIDFTCSVQHDNVMGIQFHAEKSHKFGMQLLKNLSEI